MQDLPTMECGTCAFFRNVEPPEGVKANEKKGFCWFNPPTPALIPQQSRLAMKEPQMKFIPRGIRPPVSESEFCGRWQPNAETYESMAKAQQGQAKCPGTCAAEECSCGS